MDVNTIKENLEGQIHTYHCPECKKQWKSAVTHAVCLSCGKLAYRSTGAYIYPANETPAVRTESLFEEANRIINGDKREAYGSMEDSFARIALTWSAVLKTTITAKQVALCMLGLKLCRESHKHGRDNIVDFYGYALCYERLCEFVAKE